MRARRVSPLSLAAIAVSLGAAAVTVVVAACNLSVTQNAPTGTGQCEQGCSELPIVTDAGDGGVSPDASNHTSSYNAICGMQGTACDPDPDASLPSCLDASVDADAAMGADSAAPPGSSSSMAMPPPPPPLACHLLRPLGSSPVAAATCEAFGAIGDGEICQSAQDCAPGFGCVAATDSSSHVVGNCRAYCCDANDSCPAKTYCAVVAIYDPSHPNEPFHVPVCIPPTTCQLLGDGCGPGLTCTIVGDQATTCETVGAGLTGDTCPCAANFVCVQPSNTCQRICRTDQSDGACDGGTCIGGSQAFPSGFGVCVSGS